MSKNEIIKFSNFIYNIISKLLKKHLIFSYDRKYNFPN